MATGASTVRHGVGCANLRIARCRVAIQSAVIRPAISTHVLMPPPYSILMCARRARGDDIEDE